MKRYTLVMIALILFAASGISQMHLGIRGGIYSTWVTADKIEIGAEDITFSDKSNMGYHIGIVTEWKYDRVFIQPELLYSSIRGDIEVGTDELTELEMKRIDLPIMLGFKIRSFKIQAGPMVSMLIKDKSFFTDLTDPKSDLLLNNTIFSFQAGIGVDVSRLTLDLKYEGSLSKLDDDITNTNDDFNARLNQLVFSIGLFFQDR